MDIAYMTIFILSSYYIQNNNRVSCTIDVNLSELEYLAGHLDPAECRRLVAALHDNTFELPESIAGAERKVDEDIPCLRQLLHWNSSPGEGRGQTHEDIEHRLRQLNRGDLADWLGKMTFKQLGNDLARALNESFAVAEGIQYTELQSFGTLEPMDEPAEEDPWLPVDTFIFATLVVLIALVITVCLALVIHRLRLWRHQQNVYNLIDQEADKGGVTIDEAPKKKMKKRLRKTSETTPRIINEDSRDENQLLQSKRQNRCCGTSCTIL